MARRKYSEEESWSRSDLAAVSREAKARRKAMKTCTRVGRSNDHNSAVGEGTEGGHGAREGLL